MIEGTLLISDGTQRNWDRLDSDCSNRLRSRANKSRSDKCIRPDNYIDSRLLDAVMSQIETCKCSCRDVLLYLCQKKLASLQGCENVGRFLEEYGPCADIPISVPYEILANTENDWLGFLYQACTPEGKRNLQGMYYTNGGIVKRMLQGVELGSKCTFLDPCCGTGAFLMYAGAASLSQLYGTDNDEVAVMIAKANLIALYPDDKCYPQIYCEDYLDSSIFSCSMIDGLLFDYIYTNPPWGICKTVKYASDAISSKERSSMFFVESYKRLKPYGRMSFLLPSALLKIKVHKDFRQFVLNETCINEISLYKERFNGVFTDFFSISVTKQKPKEIQTYSVEKEGRYVSVTLPLVNRRTDIETICAEETEILEMVEQLGRSTLKESVWALGIVTGDNKNKIKTVPDDGYEAIYTGKDIKKYLLNPPVNYIKYDRAQLQQCAKDEYYRCSEKLVYKFISKTLCFAYDNTSSLFLNSANILIPRISGMSIKTVMAFLNSDLFSYYYRKRYSDIKILKGNLTALPFPEIAEWQDAEISGMVDMVLSGEHGVAEKINEYIYDIYDFSIEVRNNIKTELYGNAAFRT